MAPAIPGIHHITAIASGPQRNLDFYAGTLGLRFVKRTVNFDDPYTYHFYFGDALGRPGTILTFFPWPDARPARQGSGAAAAAAYSVPAGSLEFWLDRLAREAVDFDGPIERFGGQVAAFRDPDGLAIEIDASERRPEESDTETWNPESIPPEHALRGFQGVTLCVSGYERTARLLTETFGYQTAGQEGERFRFQSPAGGPASVVDLLCRPDLMDRASMGAGAFHHVAFRARDEQEQLEWREKIDSLGFDVTPVLDRQYFKSIYFREPGGVLFEIATDAPGFTADEELGDLGQSLKLPPWLEPRRETIERRLPPIEIPGARS